MQKNESIKCTVEECRYHAQQEEYCTLNQILVGKHHSPANETKCTDCESFETK